MHGTAWECYIYKWEAEDRTGSDIWATSPQEWPDWVSRTAPRLALKYLRVQQKKKRVDPCVAVEMMWQIVHLLPGNQTAGSWFFFHARRSSEVVLLRVSWVIIRWPRPVVALTEGTSRRKRTRVVIERKATRLNYCSVGRRGNPSHSNPSIARVPLGTILAWFYSKSKLLCTHRMAHSYIFKREMRNHAFKK